MQLLESLINSTVLAETADSVSFSSVLSGMDASTVQGAIDELSAGLTSPFLFKGEIDVAADFPTLGVVTAGWLYSIQADVTDNDVTKTNTGLSFLNSSFATWNGTTWAKTNHTAVPLSYLDTDVTMTLSSNTKLATQKATKAYADTKAPIASPMFTGVVSVPEIDWTGGNVTYVPLNGDIQTYVTAATAGDTLILASGTYIVTSTITISKALLIKGQGLNVTKVNTSTAGLAVFTIAANNVELIDIGSINSGTGTAYNIYVNAGLTGFQVKNFIGLLSNSGVKYGIFSLSSITVSNSEFYPTSSDLNSNGVYLANISTATVGITANIQDVRVIATGPANNNRGIVAFNNNSSQTITVNSVNNWLLGYGSSGVTDIALYVSSYLTNTVTINDYQSVLNGADFDVLNTDTNVINLYGSVLVNGTTSGTIVYKGNVIASKYNNLALTKQTNGFTIAGGTTSKTLTVPLDASVSGTNTGDQNLSELGGVAANAAITGATKTKVTYDTKGLVTVGADATTADIAASTDKNYVTDAQQTEIGTINSKSPIQSPSFTGIVTTPNLVVNGNGNIVIPEETINIVKSPNNGKIIAIEGVKVSQGTRNNFVDLVAGNTQWYGMTSVGNDVYACVFNGSIWKSTNGGAFVDLVAGNKQWYGMTSVGNDVYACVYDGSIWKSTNGGAFVDLVAGTKNWVGVTSVGNDVYACVIEGSIWKSTNGGAFVDLVAGNKQWYGMTSVGNDVYACVYDGSIWKSTNGGAFVDLVAGNKIWSGMASIGNDAYACVNGGSIWKSTNGGAFVDLVAGTKSWRGMTSVGNDIYACVISGSIWKSSYVGNTQVSGTLAASNLSGTNTGDQVGDGVTITGAGTVASPFVSVIRATPPATAASTGVTGQCAVDANYIYVCTGSNTWVRSALTSATW